MGMLDQCIYPDIENNGKYAGSGPGIKGPEGVSGIYSHGDEAGPVGPSKPDANVKLEAIK